MSDQLGFVALWFPCYGLSYLSSLGITWDPSRNPQPARGLRVATMALFDQEEGTKHPLILILKMLYIQISIMASFDGVVLPLVKQDFCLCRSFLGLTCSRPGYKLAIRWLQASHGALKGVAGAICPATTREHHTCIFLRRIRVINL